MRYPASLLAAIVASFLFTHGAQAACQNGPLRYDYDVQRLDQALQDLAHRSGCFVAVTPDLLEGKQAAALHGRYRPLPALQRLLRGTGLQATRTREGLQVSTGRNARTTDHHDAAEIFSIHH